MSDARTLTGPAGTATELGPDDRWPASVAAWFLTCPGQSSAWDSYLLGVVHLRELNGRAAHISAPGATHELLLVALNPEHSPVRDDPRTWGFLLPHNVCEQVQLPDDQAARQLVDACAQLVVDGLLFAEPPLSGQREPWHSVVTATVEHLQGKHDD